MNLWKKAISTLAVAGLLASLLGTAVVGTALAGAPSTWTGRGLTYLADCNPTNCQQVADNFTQMKLSGAGAGTVDAGYMTVTGASFVGATGNYHWDSTAGTLIVGLSQQSSASDSISLRTAVAGPAVVSIYQQTDINTPGVLVGTVTVQFYAAGTSGISAANSFSRTVQNTVNGIANDCHTTGYTFDSTTGTSSGVADVGHQDAWLCVFVGGATAGIGVAGLSVSATISPVGMLVASGTGQAVTLTWLSSGVYYAAINGSGVSGAATITLSTSSLAGGTVALGTQTFTFTGGISKITAAAVTSAVDKSGGLQTEVISFKAYDAAGSRVSTVGTNTTAVVSTGAVFSAAVSSQTTGSAAKGYVDVTCRGTEGSGTVTVKYTSSDGLTTVSSDPVTMYCSGFATTFTVAFDKTTVIPGGSAVLTATAKDAAGQPAAAVKWVTPPAVSSGSLYENPQVDGDQGDGTYTWSYLAPFNSGVITVAVTDANSTTTSYTNMGTKYASLTVGKPVAPAALGSTAATLGVTTSRGAWSTSTQVATVGTFITWRFAAGVANAGKTIGVFVQTKNSSGVWSAPVRFSARVADSQGNAYFSWKGTKAMWVSVRGGLGDARSTPPVQGRWP